MLQTNDPKRAMATFTVLDSPGQTEQLAADELYKAEKFAEAAKLYEDCALKFDNVNSMRTLAWILENGMGDVSVNLEKASIMYRLAAAQDDGVSTMNLANLYFSGRGVRKDPIRGANLLRRLLSRVDYPPARSELARCYFTADGTPFDAIKAAELWSAAKLAGDTEAESALKSVERLKADAEKFQRYQDKIQQESSYGGGRYGPYENVWGAKGYVEYLRSLGEPVPTVPRDIRYDRLADGSFLRVPPMEEQIELAKEVYHLASKTSPLSDFELWEANDCLYRFVCGSSPDVYIHDATGETATFQAVRNDHPKLLRQLIRYRAKLDIVNNRGETVADVAPGSASIQALLPRRIKKGGKKGKANHRNAATVLANGFKMAKASGEDTALFHDPAEVERRRQTKQSLSVYGDGKKIFNKGSREHSIVQEIEEMEKKRKLREKMVENKNGTVEDRTNDAVGGGNASLPTAVAPDAVSRPVCAYSAEVLKEINHFKEKGNVAFSSGDCKQAIDLYTKALLMMKPLDKSQELLYRSLLSNRSAARLMYGAAYTAASDAFDCISCSPGWHKAYLRLGKACEAMGGYSDAQTWYETGSRIAKMQLQTREAATLAKLAKAAGDLHAKGHLHQKLAEELNFHSHLFYTPKCMQRRISVSENEDYFRYISRDSDVFVKSVHDEDGGRGLFARKTFAPQTSVLMDHPYFTFCFQSNRCGYCARELSDTINLLAEDGNEEYCCEQCKDSAWEQYYQVLCGCAAKRTRDLRTGLANIGEEECPLASSFHPLAAIKIAAATLAYEKVFLESPSGCDNATKLDTFDVPAFRCLMRPSDLGDGKLYDAQFKVPFAERYNQYTNVREILGELEDGRFDFDWYDNIWGMLMLNCISGNNGDCVCLMRLGSFINHSNDPNIALMPTKADGGALRFVALRKINEGDQLFISYCDSNLSEDDRDRLLATQYMISP